MAEMLAVFHTVDVTPQAKDILNMWYNDTETVSTVSLQILGCILSGFSDLVTLVYFWMVTSTYVSNVFPEIFSLAPGLSDMVCRHLLIQNYLELAFASLDTCFPKSFLACRLALRDWFRALY